MLIAKTTQYLMKSRWHYTLTAFLLSAIPGCAWLGIVVLGLVTLCLGAAEGLLVLLWCALPSIAIAITGHTYWGIINTILLNGFFVWFLALGLKQTGNWTSILEFSTIMAIIGIILAHIFYPGVEKFWIMYLINTYKTIATQFQISLNLAAMNEIINMMAPYLTGAVAIFIIGNALFQLMISRSMQLMTYFPKKVDVSWLEIRFNIVFVFIVMVVAVLSWMKIGFFRDLLFVVLLPFLISGLSLVHAIFVAKKTSLNKIILFYLIVFLAALLFWPLLILICLAMIDSFVNFRSRLKFKT